MYKKITLIIALGLLATNLQAKAQQYYGDGYTIIATQAVTTTDLQQTIYKEIKAKDVHEALLQILTGSGYKLADRANADPQITRLYSQNYPQMKRSLGPIQLDTALTYVAGPAWRLVVDQVNKIVSFQLNENYKCFTSTIEVCKS